MDNLPGERRFKLTLHYDGAGFFGWQVQPGVRTVQAELEAALSRLSNRPATVLAAGRTDRGVHATGQVASTLMPEKWTAEALQAATHIPTGTAGLKTDFDLRLEMATSAERFSGVGSAR